MEFPDLRLMWHEVVTGVVEVYEVPGNENVMPREPQVEVLAEKLKASFDKANAA